MGREWTRYVNGLGFAAFATAALNGCCESTCADGAAVRFDPPVTEPGAYRVFVTAGAFENDCLVSVPPSPNDPNCGLSFVNRYDGDHFVELSGFGIPLRAPELISVLVERESVVLADATVRPVYADLEGCQYDTCRTGLATLHLR